MPPLEAHRDSEARRLEARAQGYCLAEALHDGDKAARSRLSPQLQTTIAAASAGGRHRKTIRSAGVALRPPAVTEALLAPLPIAAQSLFCAALPQRTARKLLLESGPRFQGFRATPALRRFLLKLAVTHALDQR